MTAASPSRTIPSGGTRMGRRTGGVRMVRLFLVSRRVPVALVIFAGCAALLRGLMSWITATGPVDEQLPMLIEVAVASVIAVTTYSPFGESERATGRWLPYLRLGCAVALTVVASAALAIAAAGPVPGGTVGILRNVAGVTGIGLVSAVVVGGALAWIAPVAYGVVSAFAIGSSWTSPWMWPARGSHDVGGAICAGLVFALGIVVTAVRGARDSARDLRHAPPAASRGPDLRTMLRAGRHAPDHAQLRYRFG